MGAVRVLVDDTELDNGSTRLIVGHPYILTDNAGKVSEFHCDILLQADTAAAFNTIFQSTFEGLELINPRLRYWQDSSTTLPTVDWHYGDGIHPDIVSSVKMIVDESRTQRKVLCELVVVAMKQLDLSGNVPPATDTPLEGLASKIEIQKLYLDSERYTLTASGVFKSTLNPSVEGPYNLASVSSNSGKARFTLQAPDVIVDTYDADAGQFIDVSTPSAYAGRHFITGITTGNIIDTTTAIASAEGDVNATILFGDTSSAETNFQGARNLILKNLLETGELGSAHANAPHMNKLSEAIAYSSEKKDMLEFNIVSGPAPINSGVLDSGGEAVERGLMFTVKYLPPSLWNSSYAPPPVGIVISGKMAITEIARNSGASDGLSQYWEDLKAAVLAEVTPTIANRVGGAFRESNCEYVVDYATNDLSFVIAGEGNYTGTIAYNRTDTYFTKQLRSMWRNTDGTQPVQEPKGAPEKTCLVHVTWTGESGGHPPDPSAPTESGFVYLFDTSTVVSEENLTDPYGVEFTQKVIDYTYTRNKPVSGGASGGGSFGAGGSIAGLTGGMFGSGLGGSVGVSLG